MKYDVAIIGGGPAGMMAAGIAASQGSSVVLIEKNRRLGAKLLITGKGRCNITNVEDNQKEFIKKFGKNGPFLFSSFNQFSNQDAVDFFESKGVETKVERGGRVFPVSDKAADVLNVFKNYLKENKVRIKAGVGVKEIKVKNNSIEKIVMWGGEVEAEKYVLCTGGKSYPETGSTGDFYAWLKKVGHTVVEPSPVLVPVLIKEKIVTELQGLSLKNVEISVFQNNKKKDSRFGEAVFTHEGLSGPVILNMSKNIGEVLKEGEVELRIDFKPALEFSVLDERLQKDFSENTKKMFKNSLDKLLPQKAIPVFIKLSGINPDKKVCEITKEERNNLLHLFKEFKLNVKELSGFEKAIVTLGGVSLKEVDPKTMNSKIIDNLYFAGEILDLDGPTGGYNLQVCWSTGYAAGGSY